MSKILIVSEDSRLALSYAISLGEAGHSTETASDILRVHERLCGTACDLAVIDIRSPDGGMGLLIEQARAAWRECRVIALVPDLDVRNSKVHEMGLWTPDAVLVHPVPEDELIRSVAALPNGRGRRRVKRPAQFLTVP